jgi:glycosyltransferase involved in cell wall biosynthesis
MKDVLDRMGCDEAHEAKEAEAMMREPIRIVYIIDSLRLGGAERHLHRLLQQAGRSGNWQASVYCLDRRGPVIEAIENLGIPVVGGRKQWSKSPARIIRSVLALRSYLRSERPTIVHCYLPTAGLLGAIAARLTGIPYVITTRRTVHINHGFRLLRYRIVTRIMDRLSDTVIAVCEAAREQAVREGTPPSKIVTVYNSASQPQSAANVKDLSVDNMIIGSVGSLHRDKGHRYLLEAIPFVVKEVPKAKFVVVGDGPERAYLESRAIELGIGSHLTFLGQRSDVAELMPQFDVLVQPSLREGLPNAVLEASALGMAIVATAVGGVPEIIEHGRTGLLVTPGSSDEIGRALVRLAEDARLRETLESEARAMSATRFSPEKEFEKTNAIYRQLADQNSVKCDDKCHRHEDKRLKIAFVVPSYFPTWGGVQNQVRAQARELMKRDYEVEIVTWKREPHLPSIEVLDGVLVRRVDRSRRGVLRDVLAFLEMGYTLTRVAARVDIIAAYHLLTTAFLAGFAAALTGTPIISRPAAGSDQPGADLNMMVGTRLDRRLRRLLAWPLRRGAVVAISHWIAENLQELGFKHIVRIPNAIEDTGLRNREQLRNDLYVPLGIPSAAPVAVAAGRLVDAKGFDQLISAWAQVRIAQSNAVVVIVGSGPREAALRAAAVDAGVADSVIFVPFSTRARDYMSAADVAVMPSRFEGLSNVLLEAMMEGVPIVATAVSGAVDFLEDGINGRLVPPEDPEALAKALIDVLRAPADLGRRARETALEQFELSRVVDVYLWLFSTYHSLPAGISDPSKLPEPIHSEQTELVCAVSAE